MRVYTDSGRATFYCAGHPLHRPGHRLDVFPEDHESAGHPAVFNAADEFVDGDNHHAILFVWVPGCVHIDDHDENVLRGCMHGCTEYVLVSGDDPRKAAIEVVVDSSAKPTESASYGHFSLDGVNCDVCTKREGRIVTLTECTGVDD